MKNEGYLDITNFEIYMKDLREIPLLTQEEEKNLAIRMQNGDIEARKKFIQANLRLVVSIANKYKGSYIEFQDLVEEGNIGLIEACKRYDVNKGYRFSTYAAFWIKHSILLYIKRINNYYFDNTIEEDNIRVISINKLIDDDLILDIIDEAEDKTINNELKQLLKKIIEESDLNQISKKILDLKYGLSGHYLKSKQIAKLLNITNAQLKHIEAYAIRKLRNKTTLEKIYGYENKYDKKIDTLNEKNIRVKSNIKNDEIGRFKYDTLFGYFKDYTKEEVINAIKLLDKEDLKKVYNAFGNNLITPNNNMTNLEIRKFYNNIISKIKVILIKQKINTINETEDYSLIDINSDIFKKISEGLSSKEISVLWLQFGNDKLSIENTSKTLGISINEVIDINNKVLKLYQKNKPIN